VTGVCASCGCGRLLLHERAFDAHGGLIDLYRCRTCGALSIHREDREQQQFVDGAAAIHSMSRAALDREVEARSFVFDYLAGKDSRSPQFLTFLDMGCGLGFAAAAAAETYGSVTAVDCLNNGASALFEKLDLPKDRCAFASDIRATTTRFDVVLLWHVAQEIDDFYGLMKRTILPRCNPGAVIYAQVPLWREKNAFSVTRCFHNAESMRWLVQKLKMKDVDFSFDACAGFMSLFARL
jgi:2-polyprenyl-3-methyl-5-hydroxy-6-metoxy-1,4-benzoquinol methylase